MAFKLIFLKEVNTEIENTINWYEERQENLGNKFYNDLIDNLDYLATNPYMFRIKFQNLREMKLSVFPYIVIYEIFEDIVTVHAVFNTSKNPGKKPSKF